MEDDIHGIKAWAEDDRPREKLMLKGKKSLSNTELLAILLRSGTAKKTAVDVARELLKAANNDINRLARFSISDFCKFDGVGPVKAITIIAALEFASRKAKSKEDRTLTISDSKAVYNELRHLMEDLNYEQFFVTTLAQNNKILRTHQLSDGGISSTLLDIRRLFKCVLEDHATGIVLSHNHPSGSLNPSNADKKLTKNIVEAAKMLDIKVLDHVIISVNGYYSFADNRLL